MTFLDVRDHQRCTWDVRAAVRDEPRLELRLDDRGGALEGLPGLALGDESLHPDVVQDADVHPHLLRHPEQEQAGEHVEQPPATAGHRPPPLS
ncbi:MAG TPA: hypothetical protein VK324_16790 [Tepidisphaeraceae bacterium]|nr:hypothetical protein [Tepidisphaeraceae bacterium]